jgi:hypothetical protein
MGWDPSWHTHDEQASLRFDQILDVDEYWRSRAVVDALAQVCGIQRRGNPLDRVRARPRPVR